MNHYIPISCKVASHKHTNRRTTTVESLLYTRRPHPISKCSTESRGRKQFVVRCCSLRLLLRISLEHTHAIVLSVIACDHQ